MSGPSCCFRLHKNFVTQSVPNNLYDFLRWTHYGMERDSHWNMQSQIWVPPAGFISFHAQVWLHGCAINGTAQYTLKMIKNGDPDLYVATGMGSPGGPSNTVPIQIKGSDLANGTDHYHLQVYATAANGVSSTIEGHPAHTFFGGAAWPD